MKRGAALLLGLAMWAGPQAAFAQSLIEGQITKVDPSAGKITIKHGPIKKLGMDEGMTMVFKAQDPAMLKAVKTGDHVKFDADDLNGQLTLTKIVKAK
jgi:Cu(I)/Ag(I) efflux system periplasmic protein CusF